MPKYLARNPEAKGAHAGALGMRMVARPTGTFAQGSGLPMRPHVSSDFYSHDVLLVMATDPSRDSATIDDVDRVVADSIPEMLAGRALTHADGAHGARYRRRSSTRTGSETSVVIETDVGTPLA